MKLYCILFIASVSQLLSLYFMGNANKDKEDDPNINFGRVADKDLPRRSPGVIDRKKPSQIIVKPIKNLSFRKRDISEDEVENPCERFGSCHANKGMVLPICYCDTDCKMYNDCCFDAIQQSTEPTQNDKTKQDETVPLNETVFNESIALSKKKLESVSSIGKLTLLYGICETGVNLIVPPDFSSNIGIRMVSTCPDSHENRDVKEICERSDNLLPVSTPNGVVYRNVPCAICHGESDYTFWDFIYPYNGKCHYEKMSSLNLDILAKLEYIKNQKCKFHMQAPKGMPFRACFKSSFDISNTTSSNQHLCSSFQNPLKLTGRNGDIRIYGNVFCNDESIFKTKRHRCLSPTIDIFSSRRDGNLEMTGMFNLRPASRKSSGEICASNKINKASQDLGICTSIDCLEKRYDVCGTELVKNFKWETENELMFIADNLIAPESVFRVATLFLYSLPEKYQVRMTLLHGFLSCGTRITETITPCCQFIGGAKFVHENEVQFDEATNFLSAVRKMKWVFTEVHNTTTITLSNKHSQSTDTNCNITKAVRKRIRMDKADIARQGKFEDIFVLDNSSRPQTNVPDTVTGILDAEDGFRIIKLEFQYKLLNVTESTFNNVTSQSMSLTAGSVITYVTLGISCVFLSISVAIHAHLGFFRSSPGKVSQNMMVSHLAAQLVFVGSVVVENIQVVCFIVGVISHYLWLCTFCWNSIFFVDVFFMMKRMRESPGYLAHDQKFRKANIFFGYMFPALLVAPCVMLEMFSDIHIGYDGDICFPTAFPANLYVFTLPVVISLTVNIVALSIASKMLASYNSTVTNVAHVRNVRDYIPTYIRLGFLCACPWILGILSDLFDSDILGYIFTLLVGSHGFFVSVVFLSRKTVLNKLKRRIMNQAMQPTNTAQIVQNNTVSELQSVTTRV